MEAHRRYGLQVLLVLVLWLAIGAAGRDEAPIPPTLPPENVLPRITSLVAIPPNGTAPLTVQFLAAASDRDGSIESVTWDYGDGTPRQTTSSLSSEHLYRKTGTFIVKVVVRDNRGGTATATTTVAVPAIRTPAQQLAELIERMTKLGLPDATQTLQTALKQLNSANYRGACESMKSFIGQIETGSGKRVMASEAKELVSSASYIREGMRCS